MNKIGPRASLMLIAVFLAATTSVLAQSSGGDFELTRTTIFAGGGTAIEEPAQVPASVRRGPTAQGPDPKSHAHALFTVSVLGFTSAKDGDPIGRGELYMNYDGYPRSAVVRAGDNERAHIDGPTSYVLTHQALDFQSNTLSLTMELRDEDEHSAHELLGDFLVSMDLDTLLVGGTREVAVTSSDGKATVELRIDRKSLVPPELPAVFVGARNGDWARIAREYADERETIFRASYLISLMGEQDSEWGIIAGIQQADATLRSIDRNLPEQWALVEERNRRMTHALISLKRVRAAHSGTGFDRPMPVSDYYQRSL